jgi:hypothetical protein
LIPNKPTELLVRPKRLPTHTGLAGTANKGVELVPPPPPSTQVTVADKQNQKNLSSWLSVDQRITDTKICLLCVYFLGAQ